MRQGTKCAGNHEINTLRDNTGNSFIACAPGAVQIVGSGAKKIASPKKREGLAFIIHWITIFFAGLSNIRKSGTD